MRLLLCSVSLSGGRKLLTVLSAVSVRDCAVRCFQLQRTNMDCLEVRVRSKRISKPLVSLGVGALAAAGDFVPGVRVTGEGIHKWSGKRREITLTHGVGGNKEKERGRKAPAIGFEVREEEGPDFTVSELWKSERAAETATERVVSLMRLV